MNSLDSRLQEQLNEGFLMACENGDLDMAKSLLSEGAEGDARNTVGETAIHLATKSGNPGIVNYLINDLRINVDMKDAFGRTALHWAAQQGNIPIAEMLLLAHAKADAKDDSGVEPKIYAEMSGHRDLVQLFSLVRSK